MSYCASTPISDIYLIGNGEKRCNKTNTTVQKGIDEFTGEAQTNRRNVEEMSSTGQQQKPSQGGGGTGGARRRSQRLENRRKGTHLYAILIHNKQHNST